MSYNVGDKVRIVSEWNSGCNQNGAGEMDHWLGQVMTIREITTTGSYYMEEDQHEHYGDGWIWNDNCIAGLATTITLKEFFDSEQTLAIHCPTKEDAEQLVSYFAMLGKTWRSGEFYTDIHYDYGSEQCYFNKGTYGRRKFYLGDAAKIYEFADVDLSAMAASQESMKVLTRMDYAWTDAVFDNKTGRLSVRKYGTIREKDIVAVENDRRRKYVKCACCDEIIPNDETAIAEHIRNATGIDKCAKCRHFKTMTENEVQKTFTIRTDGKYDVVRTSVSELGCSFNGNRTIGSDESFAKCKFADCAKGVFHNMGGVFEELPGVFDQMATVDALDAKSWSFYSKSGSNVNFKARKRFTLYARANGLGIVDHFTYKSRMSEVELFYSAKYNRLFAVSGGKYVDIPSWIEEERKNEILGVISKIYKEEDHEQE